LIHYSGAYICQKLLSPLVFTQPLNYISMLSLSLSVMLSTSLMMLNNHVFYIITHDIPCIKKDSFIRYGGSFAFN
jgi:hypothetical protein